MNYHNQQHSDGGRAVIAAIVSGDHALVIRQPDRDDPKWKFPGGTVEPYETLSEALVREVQEETGFSIPYRMEPDGTLVLGDDTDIIIEEIREREMRNQGGSHMQYFFLVRVRDEKQILHLDKQFRKEDETEVIETGIFSLKALGGPDFLWKQRALVQDLNEHLGLVRA